MLKKLKRWQITAAYENGRILLIGGDTSARKHFQNLLEQNPDFEVQLILELAQQNSEIFEAITERAAIREADGLPGDIESAVKCNIIHS
mgnify:CR=1 FL=1